MTCDCGVYLDNQVCPECSDTVRGGELQEIEDYSDLGGMPSGYDWASLPSGGNEPGQHEWAESRAAEILEEVASEHPDMTPTQRHATAVLWVHRILDKLRG